MSLAYYDHSFAMNRNGTMIVSDGMRTSPVGLSLMGGRLYRVTPDGVKSMSDDQVDHYAPRLFGGLASTASGGVGGGFSTTVSPTSDVFGVARGLTTAGVSVADTYGRPTTDARDIVPRFSWQDPSDQPRTAPMPLATIGQESEAHAAGTDAVTDPRDDSIDEPAHPRGLAVTEESEDRATAPVRAIQPVDDPRQTTLPTRDETIAQQADDDPGRGDMKVDLPSATEMPQREDPVLPSYDVDLIPADRPEDEP
jgi:hypothetical protein